jgi:hypothetical protein
MISIRNTSFAVAALLFTTLALAGAGKPTFSPAIFADGKPWGTKGLGALPAPNEHNVQSFDKLFMFVNGAAGQLPVSEAGPGNPMYNGGRWYTHVAIWTEAGGNFYLQGFPVVTSYEDIKWNVDLGYLMVMPGSAGGEPPAFFLCPLLPVK